VDTRGWADWKVTELTLVCCRHSIEQRAVLDSCCRESQREGWVGQVTQCSLPRCEKNLWFVLNGLDLFGACDSVFFPTEMDGENSIGLQKFALGQLNNSCEELVSCDWYRVPVGC